MTKRMRQIPPESLIFGSKIRQRITTKTFEIFFYTYEKLTTVMTQVKATLYSRQPENDVQVLTPPHFLIGRSIQRNK